MIWKMIYDLEYWLHIGIADDIVRSRANREDYLPLVIECERKQIPPEKIPETVLVMLKNEAKIPFYKSKIFWRLVWLKIKGVFK